MPNLMQISGLSEITMSLKHSVWKNLQKKYQIMGGGSGTLFQEHPGQEQALKS